MGEDRDLFKRILRSGPSQSTLYCILTQMKDQGKISQVIQECIEALRFYPDDTRLRKLLADCYSETGYVGLAQAELERIVSQIHDLVTAFKIQGEIYAKQKRTKEAAAAFKKYLAHYPEDVEALARLRESEAFDKEKPSEAPIGEKPDTEEPAKEMDEFVAGLATPTLAEIIFDQGQVHEAISVYEKVVSDNPKDQASAARLAELRKMVAEEPVVKAEQPHRMSKEKMIAILEDWLTRIRNSQNV